MVSRMLPARLVPIASQSLCQCSARPLRLSHRSWQSHSLKYRSFSAATSLLEKKYTRDHEWIEASADGKTATLGISTYAAEALGDVIYVELPTVDTEVGHGDAIGAVESVKSASDIMSPVSGKITEANGKLEEKPKLLNESPEEDGWIAKIEVADAAELDGLMDAEAYKAFTDEESA